MPSSLGQTVKRSSTLLCEVEREGAARLRERIGSSTGEGVRLGIVDTGIDQAALASRYGASCKLFGGIFTNGNEKPLPYAGIGGAPHGTTVADIILKHAPEVSIYSADIFSRTGQCTVDTLIHAIHWCLTEEKCQIINLSLGITEQQLFPIQRRGQLQRLIEECYHRGVIVVAAAHNDHPQTRSYPAAFSVPLISVRSCKKGSVRLSVYSPHEQIEFVSCSTGYWGPLANNPSTSWAAPHVTATVARMLSCWPKLTLFEVKTMLAWMNAE